MDAWHQKLCPPGTVVDAHELLYERLWSAIKAAVDAGIPRSALAARIDLDDTLASPAARTLAILRAFLRDHLADEGLPHWSDIQAKAAALRVYGPRRPWELLIGPSKGELYGRWMAYWNRRFFSNEFIREDEPIWQGRDFVATVSWQLNVTYLTGRHSQNEEDEPDFRPGMRDATVDWLEEMGFPLGHIFMKPRFGMEDLAFKTEHLSSRAITSGSFPLLLLDDRPQMVAMHARIMREVHGADFCLSVLVPRHEHEGTLPDGALVLPSYDLNLD